MSPFISKEKIFANATKLTEILLESSHYEDFHQKLVNSDFDYKEEKTYDLAPSGFIDFNQHLYEDINHMNSISSGLYLERSLVTFRIFVWSSVGEGFEIFKHVLRGTEINDLKTIEDIRQYIFKCINELEQGIVKTYDLSLEKSFEEFGKGIENKKLPLPSILSCITIENNLGDFR